MHSIILQAAAQCYIDLVVKESDNNVKLIVLDRLTALRDVRSHEKVLQVERTNHSHLYGLLFVALGFVDGYSESSFFSSFGGSQEDFGISFRPC